MIALDSTRTIDISLAAPITTNNIQVVVCYSDDAGNSFRRLAPQVTEVGGSGDSVICDAPDVDVVRAVDYISILNSDTVEATPDLHYSTGGTLLVVTLQPGEHAEWTRSGWRTTKSDGSPKAGEATFPYTPEDAANKDTEDGYVGQSGWMHKLHNALGTIVSLLTNNSTAPRTYTFPDKDIDVAGTDDVAAVQDAVDAINAAIGAVNGIAELNADGQVPVSQIPSIAITEYLGSVASQVAMLALVGEQGDWAIRSDLGTVWLITGSDPTNLSDWTELAYPALTAAQLATLLHAAANKIVLVDNDEVNGTDSANSYSLIRTKWSDVWTYIKSKADTFYQATLVSGTNIKTVNSTSLLGSGDIVVGASAAGSDTQFQYNNATAFAGANLYREDANTVAQRNGVTSQTLQVYNTYTNASNYERVSMRWSSNVALIGTQNAGTGSARELYLSNASGNVGLAVSNSGFLKFVDGAVERFTMGESSGVYIGTSTSRTMRFAGGQFNAGNFTLMVGDAVTSLSTRSHTIRTADRQEFNGDYGTGPTLNIRAGNAAQNAGSGNYDGGSLYIDGGAKAGSGNDGDIYVGNTRGKLRVIQEALFSKVMTPAQYTNATEPSFVNGQVFFNTDLDKLRIGGATGWETVTST